jgi:hypothetical protein
MANHLTPTELAREAGLERRDVIARCVELGIPIFNGRIDKTLFLSSLREQPAPSAAESDATHFTLLDADGNMIESFDDEATARKALKELLRQEPAARGEVALIAYDRTGHPLRNLASVRTRGRRGAATVRERASG